MEEKKIESEPDEDESKQNKKWIESPRLKHLADEELVAGYQTEYSGIKFGLFYVAS